MSTFQENSGKAIQTAFEEFHKANPHVYSMFKKEMQKAIKAGKTQVSSKQIIGTLRWNKHFITEEKTLFNDINQAVAFKINDAYTSRYARLFAKDFPDYAKFLKIKSLRSV